MILRRITEHVKAQNWTAVAIDFVIVVVGVFIGIQLGNWNEVRIHRDHERTLIQELRSEASRNALTAEKLGEGLMVGADAARRVLSVMDRGGGPCTADCWEIIVDLMHASQWQRSFVSWTTYDELRREGLPSDRRIIEAVETYRIASHRAAQALEAPPAYRSLVRRIIPIELQDEYWSRCFQESDGIESYVYPCPARADAEIEPEMIEEILSNPELRTLLREWTSLARVVGDSLLGTQQEAAERILAAIDGAES